MKMVLLIVAESEDIRRVRAFIESAQLDFDVISEVIPEAFDALSPIVQGVLEEQRQAREDC